MYDVGYLYMEHGNSLQTMPAYNKKLDPCAYSLWNEHIHGGLLKSTPNMAITSMWCHPIYLVEHGINHGILNNLYSRV